MEIGKELRVIVIDEEEVLLAPTPIEEELPPVGASVETSHPGDR